MDSLITKDSLITVDMMNAVVDKIADPGVDKKFSRWYLWPECHGNWSKCPGYSYELPKEEQIRSALASELWKTEKTLELEWNFYQRDGKFIQKQEVDIAAFPDEKVVHLIEVKRIWNLNGWVKKSENLISSVRIDAERLQSMMGLKKVQNTYPKLSEISEIKIQGHIVVASFYDDQDLLGTPDQPTNLDGPFDHPPQFSEEKTLEVVRDNWSEATTVKYRLWSWMISQK